MPIFKSTFNILKTPDQDEVFDPNWMDSDTLILPPKKNWDYKREMQIEDVDIWEVISEGFMKCGVYASWSPYAEFYMIIIGSNPQAAKIETYYGKKSLQKTINRMKEIGIPVNLNKVWVDKENLWLYE